MSLIRVKNPGEAWSTTDESASLPDWWDLAANGVEFAGSVTISPSDDTDPALWVKAPDGYEGPLLWANVDDVNSYGMYLEHTGRMLVYGATSAGSPLLEVAQNDAAGSILQLKGPGDTVVLDVLANAAITAKGWIDMPEQSNPGNPGQANTGRLYVRDNGSGKSQLAMIFSSGAVQVIATEP